MTAQMRLLSALVPTLGVRRSDVPIANFFQLLDNGLVTKLVKTTDLLLRIL
jgi:hypothetical protein